MTNLKGFFDKKDVTTKEQLSLYDKYYNIMISLNIFTPEQFEELFKGFKDEQLPIDMFEKRIKQKHLDCLKANQKNNQRLNVFQATFNRFKRIMIEQNAIMDNCHINRDMVIKQIKKGACFFPPSYTFKSHKNKSIMQLYKNKIALNIIVGYDSFSIIPNKRFYSIEKHKSKIFEYQGINSINFKDIFKGYLIINSKKVFI